MWGNPPATTSTQLILVNSPSCDRSHNYYFSIFCGQDNKIRVNLHSPWDHFAFQPSHPSYISRTPSPSIYTLPRKAPCLCHSICHSYAPLETHFPCVAWNISSVHSPCYSLDIVKTVEGWWGGSIVGEAVWMIRGINQGRGRWKLIRRRRRRRSTKVVMTR